MAVGRCLSAITCRATMILLVALVSVGGVHGREGDIWPLYRGDPQRTGCSPFKGPAAFKERWRTELGYEVWTAPVVDRNGRLYLAVGPKLATVDPDGTPAWHHDFVASKHSHPFGGGSGAFPSASPGLDREGLLVQPVGSLFLLAHVIALQTRASSPQEHFLWAHETKAVSRCAPLVIDGVTYTTVADAVIALAADGKPLWRTGGRYFLGSSPALSLDGTTIYVGGSDGNLHALDRTSGAKRWSVGKSDGGHVRLAERDASGAIVRQFTTAGHVPECPAVGADGAVTFGSWDGFLRRVEPDGTIRWSIDLHDRLTSAPAVTPGGDTLISSFEGVLHKVVVEDGRPRVAWRADAKARYSSPLITSDGQVLVGTLDGGLRAYALATGELIHELTLIEGWGAVTASPVPGGDGIVYIGGQDGLLRAVE